MAERIVTVIQPRLLLPSLSQESGKQRVAAYARVSTDSDEQMGSVEAQKDYFEKLIQKRPDWEFAGIYADEGISGTSLNRRDAFNRMVADALSRFARNTVDTLNTIRKLKIGGSKNHSAHLPAVSSGICHGGNCKYTDQCRYPHPSQMLSLAAMHHSKHSQQRKILRCRPHAENILH